MKPRKVLVTLTMRTDIPMKWLNHKIRWQNLLDRTREASLNPIPKDYLVEKVDAIVLE